ncbi:MAG: MmgE/PrpD family protein [Deltaproteobacteria bacterium]|nr:MmgE/PrpD family protein [Deltaproteobacteria bacterium]
MMGTTARLRRNQNALGQGGQNSRPFAQIMADFTFGLKYDSIPGKVITLARRHLADSMACALGAYNTAAAQAVRRYATEKGGRAEATIIGTNRKVPVGLAALVNGTMVRYLDANDIYVFSRGGPSGHCSDGTPGLLALAEQYRHSGEELLTCLVASYELQGALAESFNFWDCGLALTNVGWVIPIVAARLMGATPKQAVHACGLSVATEVVLNTWLRPTHTIPMIKGVAVGLVLARALEAAELAALGVTATEDALETALSGLVPSGDAGIIQTRLEQLGKRWTTPRNMIKAYPAQLYTQAAIEAVLRLYHSGIRADGLRKLILYGHRNVCGGVQGSPQAFAPASREAADHSTPYVMAMALLRGRLTCREYDGAPWKTPEVKALMAKIELVEDPERNKALDTEGILGVRLVAELTNPGAKEITVQQPKGHPDATLSDAELLEKMTWLLESLAPAPTAERLLDLCSRLSTAEDVQRLVETCIVTQT